MDEGVGTVTKDALGRFDGSLAGGATWVEGRLGSAISFNGTN